MISAEMTAESWLRANDPYFSYLGKGKKDKLEYSYYSSQTEQRKVMMEIPASNLSLKQFKQALFLVDDYFEDRH